MTENERNHDEQHPPIKITDRRRMHRDENDSSVGAGEGASTHDAPTAPDEAGPAGDAGQGGSELEQARREVKEYLDHARRLQAEFDNYRKRVLKEQTRAVQLASEPLVRRLLEVLDDFELALMAAEEMTAEQRPELQRLLKGVELVYAKLVDSLKAEGLERIEAEGKPFDPEQHEALMQTGDADGGGGGELIVADVLRQGYRLNGHVLRPAGVRVERR